MTIIRMLDQSMPLNREARDLEGARRVNNLASADLIVRFASGGERAIRGRAHRAEPYLPSPSCFSRSRTSTGIPVWRAAPRTSSERVNSQAGGGAFAVGNDMGIKCDITNKPIPKNANAPPALDRRRKGVGNTPQAVVIDSLVPAQCGLSICAHTSNSLGRVLVSCKAIVCH